MVTDVVQAVDQPGAELSTADSVGLLKPVRDRPEPRAGGRDARCRPSAAVLARDGAAARAGPGHDVRARVLGLPVGRPRGAADGLHGAQPEQADTIARELGGLALPADVLRRENLVAAPGACLRAA